MKRALLMFVATVLASVALLAAPAAAATNVFKGVDCAKAKANAQKHGGGVPAVCSPDKNGGSNPLTGDDGVIMRVANIIAVVAGVAAVIIIIVSGLKFVTAGGDANEVAAARRTIIYAILGLVIIVSARFIIGLLVGGL
jgi:hypothetical protein